MAKIVNPKKIEKAPKMVTRVREVEEDDDQIPATDAGDEEVETEAKVTPAPVEVVRMAPAPVNDSPESLANRIHETEMALKSLNAQVGEVEVAEAKADPHAIVKIRMFETISSPTVGRYDMSSICNSKEMLEGRTYHVPHVVAEILVDRKRATIIP